MKRFTVLLSTFILGTIFVQVPANASQTGVPSIVVIDTGIDSTYAPLKGRITHEVCIMIQKLRPNKSDFMEGRGAATIDSGMVVFGKFIHGTQMSTIVAQNSSANIIHIRIIGQNSDGSRASSNVTAFERSFKWILDNTSKYNIAAVSISQEIMNTSKVPNFCMTNANVESGISKLKAMNIPTVIAAGNGSNYLNIGFPACISDAIAIGATDPKGPKGEFPALYSNWSAQLDFSIFGLQTKAPFTPTSTGRTVGTSNSAALFAAKWVNAKVANPTWNYKTEYDYFKSISTLVSTTKVKNVLVVPS